MRTAEQQEKPIPQYIRVCDCNIKVDYYGQPTRCYMCRKFGHIKTDCPFNVQTPPILYSEERNDAQIDEPRNDRPTTSTLTSSMLLLQVRHEVQTEAPRDNASLCNAPTHQPDKPATHMKDDDDAEQPSAYQAHKENDEIMSSSSTEADDKPEASIFDTNDEDKDLGKKRQHSPEQHDELTKKPTIRNEVIECKCGCPVILPNQLGPFTDCRCGLHYVKFVCKNVITTKGDNAVNCVKCGKTIPRLNLDTTM